MIKETRTQNQNNISYNEKPKEKLLRQAKISKKVIFNDLRTRIDRKLFEFGV
jgi:hypothetical protein